MGLESSSWILRVLDSVVVRPLANPTPASVETARKLAPEAVARLTLKRRPPLPETGEVEVTVPPSARTALAGRLSVGEEVWTIRDMVPCTDPLQSSVQNSVSPKFSGFLDRLTQELEKEREGLQERHPTTSSLTSGMRHPGVSRQQQ